MALSDEQLERYARHIILREVGGGGQVRLANARVLIIGAGGLGSPADRVRLFFADELIWTPHLHTSVGLEVWVAMTLLHRVATDFRLGYAYGFGPRAYEDGQFYFLSSSAF